VTERNDWPCGPWDNEPDMLDWEHAGLKCAIRRGPMGHLCGYVGIYKNHPLYGVDYNARSETLRDMLNDMMDKPVPDRFAVLLAALAGEIDPRPDVVFEVHGGLTYSDWQAPEMAKDGCWWYGFDCAHVGDLAPKDMNFRMEHGWELRGDTYRDIEYVKAETERLADQLAALES